MTRETEADTRANRIDPVLVRAGWGVVEGSVVRREVICPGRVLAGGRRGKGLTCDYVLMHRGRKLAALEAKRFGLGAAAGVAQAKDYALRLGTRFAYASDGGGWYGIDMDRGREAALGAAGFPTPAELWARCFGPDPADAGEEHRPLSPAAWRLRFGAVPFEAGGGKWQPRYYQERAVNAVLEALGAGRRRVLLTLATGTGKTSIAFQIAWKLFEARWNLSGAPARRPRILFLADRNILANQAYNAFSAVPADALMRITPETIRKGGRVPKNAAVFFTIFQTLTTDAAGETGTPSYRAYPPDFFDLVVIDECHRGGANAESEWRGILEHFAPAAQLGLTATPRRGANADTYDYFGEPVYSYALRQGIEDGFLTPFKVRQMASTIDDYVWGEGDVVVGVIERGRTYRESEMNRILFIPERERSRVAEFMGAIDQRQKTLVFCATQEHAAFVRDCINQIAVSRDPLYCVRVTADEGELGERHLRRFQDSERSIPTILTTSQKLSTGVDARDVRHIVLLRPVRSMIEFKQIIGRGTRLHEGKDHFTIHDFVRAYEHFNDPEWDGEPLEPESRPEPGPRGQDDASGTDEDGFGGDESGENGEHGESGGGERPERIVVTLGDGRKRQIRYMASVSYWSPDGRPVSAAEFIGLLYGDLAAMIGTEDELRALWSDPGRRRRFLAELEDRGHDGERLEDARRLIEAPDSDIFDVLAYVRFLLAPRTRRERAQDAEAELAEFEPEMRAFLEAVLSAYERNGTDELDPERIGDFLQVLYGGINDAKARLGPIPAIRRAFSDMQAGLYRH